MGRTKTARKTPRAAKPDLEAPLLEPSLERAIRRLESTTTHVREQLQASGGVLLGPLMRHRGIERVRGAITPEIERTFVQLVESREIEADRGPHAKKLEKKAPYPAETIIHCAILAMLDQLPLTGDFWCISHGKPYVKGDGWQLLLNQIDGFSDLTPYPGTPFEQDGRVCVRYGASWRLHGCKRELRDAFGVPGIVFPVVVDEDSTPGGLVGKARTAAYRLVFKIIKGSVQTFANDEPAATMQQKATVLGERLDDDQAELLEDAIREHGADPRLICKHYDLRPGERLLVSDLAGCLALVKSGKFTPAAQVA